MTPSPRGLWHGPKADLLVVAGEDRLRFLNGYVTCDVKSLAPGAGAYGFLTSPQGRVLADLVVLALGDRLLLEAPAGRGAQVLEHLSRYVIADRVRFESLGTQRGWTEIGAAAGPADWTVEERADGTVTARRGRLGVAAITTWFEAVERAAAVGDHDLEPWRIAAGHGRFGVDFDERHFPQETGAEGEAVSYTKGCYLGQEIVARIHYRGQAQNGLRRLDLEPGAAIGSGLRFEEREVGRLTSADDWEGGRVGLSVLHRRAHEPGTVLEVENGGSATVLPLLA
jgi:folate-binding protein YgfZ